MRRDFQIAILLALAAIPAGVALMAAPEYIGILKEYPGPFFWGGFALTAGLFGAAIAIAFRGEAAEPESGHRRRMIALIGMIIFGLGFLGSATVYFWPARSITDLAGTPESASDIVFLPPKRTYTLRWDPPHQMGIYTFPDPYHGEPDQTEVLIPVFLIKNRAHGLARYRNGMDKRCRTNGAGCYGITQDEDV